MIRCLCGKPHSGHRPCSDLAADLEAKMHAAAQVAEPEAAYVTLWLHLRCLIAELRGLCGACTERFALGMPSSRGHLRAVPSHDAVAGGVVR